MTKSYLTKTQRSTLVWRWMPSCAGRQLSRKEREELRSKYKKMYWLMGGRSAPVDTIYLDALQTDIESCVDLQHTAVGMHEAEQHWHDLTNSKQRRVQFKRDGTRWRTGGEVKEKLANGVGSHYSSHYLGTWCIQHYYRWCAHLGCQ